MTDRPTATTARGSTPGCDVEKRVDLLLAEMTLRGEGRPAHQVRQPRPGPTTPSSSLDGQHRLEPVRQWRHRRQRARRGRPRRRPSTQCQRTAVEASRLGIPCCSVATSSTATARCARSRSASPPSCDEDLVEEVRRRSPPPRRRVDGVAWTFAPMVDISEEPRWGRVAESLGESPVLAGRLAAAMVRGFQGDGSATAIGSPPAPSTSPATAWSPGGRDYDTVSVGENTLRNLHLRPFQAAVDAGVAPVMAAFNDVDGIPMHAHRHLLRDVLKGEWGFDGVVVADWNGVGQLVIQGVAADLRDAARQAIEAGVDLDMCSGAYGAHLADLVESGEVRRWRSSTTPSAGCCGSSSGSGCSSARTPRGPSVVATRPTVARGAGPRARRTRVHVLVKNDGVLPLPTERRARVHLAGPFAEEGEALLGTWILDGRGEDVVSPGGRLPRAARRAASLVSDGRFSDRARPAGPRRRRHRRRSSASTRPLRRGQLGAPTSACRPASSTCSRSWRAIGKPLVVVVYTGRPLELGRGPRPRRRRRSSSGTPASRPARRWPTCCSATSAPHGRLPMTFPRTDRPHPDEHPPAADRPARSAAEDDRKQGRYLDALVFPRAAVRATA